jgi:sterol desaturase/sphingolipid hydroxylase (fatty acid hydroxylase superfamily)
MFIDFGIYWIHRGLHLPFFYRNFHKPHHKVHVRAAREEQDQSKPRHATWQPWRYRIRFQSSMLV